MRLSASVLDSAILKRIFFSFLNNYLFSLRWVFVAACRLFLVATGGGSS